MDDFVHCKLCRMPSLARRIMRIGAALLLAAISSSAPVLAFPGPGSNVDIFRGMTRSGEVTTDSIGKAIQTGKTEEIRRYAALACADFGPDAQELVPVLIAALEREDEVARSYVSLALGSIGPRAQAAVPALLKVLITNGDQEEAVWARLRAAEAIGRIGVPSDAAISALCAIITRADADDGFESATQLAVAALGLFGSHARGATPVLISVLKRREQSPDVREAAATAFGKVAAPGDRQVISVLSQAARMESGGVNVSTYDDYKEAGEGCARVAAALALWKRSHDRKVVPWLCDSLKQKTHPFYLHDRIADALGEIGPDAAAAVPTLISTINWHGSDAAMRALGRIGRKAEAAAPILANQLSHRGEDGMTRAAARALGEIGKASEQILGALRDALEYDDYETKIAAAKAIRRLHGDIEPTIPVLVECLKVMTFETGMVGGYFLIDRRRAVEVRKNAALALGELGRQAAVAAPDLRAILDDPFFTVRDAAAQALSMIHRDSLR
jgi:HEAT repeat protein